MAGVAETGSEKESGGNSGPGVYLPAKPVSSLILPSPHVLCLPPEEVQDCRALEL